MNKFKKISSIILRVVKECVLTEVIFAKNYNFRNRSLLSGESRKQRIDHTTAAFIKPNEKTSALPRNIKALNSSKRNKKIEFKKDKNEKNNFSIKPVYDKEKK